jgi:hypothetical protein
LRIDCSVLWLSAALPELSNLIDGEGGQRGDLFSSLAAPLGKKRLVLTWRVWCGFVGTLAALTTFFSWVLKKASAALKTVRSDSTLG